MQKSRTCCPIFPVIFSRCTVSFPGHVGTLPIILLWTKLNSSHGDSPNKNAYKHCVASKRLGERWRDTNDAMTGSENVSYQKLLRMS